VRRASALSVEVIHPLYLFFLQRRCFSGKCVRQLISEGQVLENKGGSDGNRPNCAVTV
jgi:hypothetical protein